MSRRHLFALAALLIVGVPPTLAWRSGDGIVTSPADVDETVAFRGRVGEYVERYYGRAQHIVALEKVTLQSLGSDLSPIAPPLRFEYEVRVEWHPSTPLGAGSRDGSNGGATVVRELLKVNGRPPKRVEDEQCLPPVSPEPLAMLLPAKQREFLFALGRPAKVDGRAVRVLTYRSATPPGPVDVTWTKKCFSFDTPGRSAGRIWADAASGEVLRLEDRLVGQVELPIPLEQRPMSSVDRMTIDRADTTIHYKRFVFQDPEETLLLPTLIESTSVTREPVVRRGRITQALSNYRRFVTGTRVID